MTPQMKSILKETRNLTQDELMELMKEISGLLESKHPGLSGDNDFWHPKTLDQVIKEQNVQIVEDLSDFAADFWPEEESADDFLQYIDQQHQEDVLSD